MASESSPLLPAGVVPPSNSPGDGPTVAYFLDRQDFSVRSGDSAAADPREIEVLPEGSTADEFLPRPVAGPRSVAKSAKSTGAWFNFFSKKPNAFSASADPTSAMIMKTRSVPVKVDPKVFFANERTFLAWLHVSIILAGASVAIVAFSDSHVSGVDQLYGVILLPVSISFILYAMIQYTRRSSMIRRKAPGPYVDTVGPVALTVILMISIVAQFSIKLYTLM
mmetsp:Transcript_24445/g.58108  ORF Transcript_24445/g.58108 Transcript_24445/m.58108 type:complete len:223 (+) Transcript_24445:94-762(+)